MQLARFEKKAASKKTGVDNVNGEYQQNVSSNDFKIRAIKFFFFDISTGLARKFMSTFHGGNVCTLA